MLLVMILWKVQSEIFFITFLCAKHFVLQSRNIIFLAQINAVVFCLSTFNWNIVYKKIHVYNDLVFFSSLTIFNHLTSAHLAKAVQSLINLLVLNRSVLFLNFNFVECRKLHLWKHGRLCGEGDVIARCKLLHRNLRHSNCLQLFFFYSFVIPKLHNLF